MTTSTESLADRLAALRSADAPTAPVVVARQEQAPAPRPSLAHREAKPNIYGGDCVNCSKYVGAGAGLLAGKVNGKWAVKHADCSIVPAAPAADVPTEEHPAGPANPHPGLYTVESAEGHTTFRVYSQSEDADFAPGELLLQRLTGSDNTGDYTTVAFLKNGYLRLFKKFRVLPQPQWVKDAYTLLADPDAALTAKNCIACNRILTTPESIAAGIGPTCAGRS